MLRKLFLYASENAWLRERLPRSKAVRRAVVRFVPGEDFDTALAAATDLGRSGRSALISYLGENVSTAAEADQVAREYTAAVNRLGTPDNADEVSLKLTQLGLDIGGDACCERLRNILREASKAGVRVWIDMEGSAYTDTTIDVYRRLRPDYANLGICLQAYLHRSFADLQTLLDLSPAIRVVKGAYAEPSAIAYRDQRDTATNFIALATELLRRHTQDPETRLVLGTHDHRLIHEVAGVAERIGVGKASYELAFLYGVREKYQRQLTMDGHAVRTLISYGEAWFPWFMRRLAERPANLRFVVPGLTLGLARE